MENVPSKNGITTTFVETDNLKNIENVITKIIYRNSNKFNDENNLIYKKYLKLLKK